MREFLILKLQGPMQAWGEHTFEGLRSSADFPTRSGVLGLLGACLGIRRNEQDRLLQIAESVGLAVRVDERVVERSEGNPRRLRMVKMTDYHTIQGARVEYTGLKSHDTIQTWREYLIDAEFTVAIWIHLNTVFTLEIIEAAIKRPVFTPYLGRRSCPLARPLFEKRVFSSTPQDALREIAPKGGMIYSEEGDYSTGRRFRMRDVPLVHQPRQFAGRNLYVYGGEHVSE